MSRLPRIAPLITVSCQSTAPSPCTPIAQPRPTGLPPFSLSYNTLANAILASPALLITSHVVS